MLGLALLETRVERLAKALDVKLKLVGAVISRVGRRSIHRSMNIGSLRQQLGKKVLPQVLTERVAVARSAARQESVFHSKDIKSRREFALVCRDILERMGVSLEDS